MPRVPAGFAPVMTSFGAQLLLALQTALQVLMLPVNIVAVLVGVLAGAVLAPMFRRIGVAGAASLVLLLPFAAMLEPGTGLMLLGAVFVTGVAGPALAVAGSLADGSRRLLLDSLIAAAGLAFAVIVVAMAGSTLSDGLSVAVLLSGLGGVAIVTAVDRPSARIPALVLGAIGLAVQCGPVPPLESGRLSPAPLLLGLLVTGPALLALLNLKSAPNKARLLGDQTIVGGGLHAVHGVPLTLAGALFILAIADGGLTFGMPLLSERPKVVLGFAVGLFTATVFGVLVAGLVSWVGCALPHNQRQKLAALSRPRLAAVVLLGLVPIAYYWSGLGLDGTFAALDPEQLARFGIGVVVGALLAWAGYDLAPLVVGLVIGQLVQAPWAALLAAAEGNVATVLKDNVGRFLLVPVAVLIAAIVWPQITNLTGRVFNRSRPEVPPDRAAR